MSSFKVLAPLTASSGANIVNGLSVSGTSSLAAVTATTVSGSGAGQFGGGLTVVGTGSFSDVVATSVSASGISTFETLSANTVTITAGNIDGTVIGDNVQAAGSFTNISGSGTLEIGGASTLAGLVTAGNGLTVSGSSQLSGAVLFQSNTEVLDPQNNVLISTSSLNNLSSSLVTLFNAVLSQNSLTPASAKNAYEAVRFANGEFFPAGGTNEVYVWLAEAPVGQSQFTNTANTPSMTGSSVQGISGSTATALLDQMKYVSFDVKTRASGSSTWTNDLVSVDVSAQQSGSDYYPVFTISAPGLGEGNGLHEFSLIVVNEGMDTVGGYNPQ